MIIAVWGSNGAGKTMIAAHLAQVYAQRVTTIAIGGALSHSSLQHCFGLSDNQKSLKKVLLNASAIFDNLIAHNQYDHLFLLDNSAGEDCLAYADIIEEQAQNLLQAAAANSELTIVDCAVSYDNVLTRAALLRADRILYILDHRLESASFYFAHKQLLQRLRLEPKMTYILNKCGGVVSSKALSREMNQSFHWAIPFVSRFGAGISNGAILGKQDVLRRRERRFLRILQKIADDSLNGIEFVQ